MKTTLTNVKADARLPHCAIADPFKNYKPESERNVRELKFKMNPNNSIKAITNWFLQSDFNHVLDSHSIFNKNLSGLDYYYGLAINFAKGLNYSPEDIAKFLLTVKDDFLRQEQDFEKTMALGLFLSALMNVHKEKSFVLITRHLDCVPDYFGYKNTKNIVVQGNLSSWVGDTMCDGKIVVNGNVSLYLGHFMAGGTIEINGDVGSDCGENMEGGSIFIKGNAEREVGSINGGDIYIEGDYESLSNSKDIKGGNIFHKGKQIVKNGKRLI